MNQIASFRECSLSDEELLKKVDEKTDSLYQDDSTRNRDELLVRHIPARPDEDYDLLIGEMLLRFQEKNIRITLSDRGEIIKAMAEYAGRDFDDEALCHDCELTWDDVVNLFNAILNAS